MWTKVPFPPLSHENRFTKFISSPLCSYSTRRHQIDEVKNYVMSLEVEGKADVLMGLASASLNYGQKDMSSSKRQVISLSSSVYARKGFLVPSKKVPKYIDNGVNFNVQGMEIGMEDILIVTSEYERDDKRTEHTTEFKARVLFFSISGKLENIHKNSKVKGIVRIDHYSSSSRGWKTREFDINSYDQALHYIKGIEAHMRDIPSIVSEKTHDALPHLRMIVAPSVTDGSKIALYLELQNKIKEIQVNLAELKGFTACYSRINYLNLLLAELKDIDIGNCSWEALETLPNK